MGSKKNTVIYGLETAQLSWERIGTIDATAAAADAVLGVAERDFSGASALDNSVVYYVPAEANSVEVRFLSETADANMVVDVWASRGDDEMARVCTVTIKTGTQDAAGTTYHFADTATITNNLWLTTVMSIIPAAEHQARIKFDCCGYDRILFHGNTTFDEDMIVECSGY